MEKIFRKVTLLILALSLQACAAKSETIVLEKSEILYRLKVTEKEIKVFQNNDEVSALKLDGYWLISPGYLASIMEELSYCRPVHQISLEDIRGSAQIEDYLQRHTQ